MMAKPPQPPPKRVGRPRGRSQARRVTITISLSPEVFAALDAVTDNRSAFIEECLRNNGHILAELWRHKPSEKPPET